MMTQREFGDAGATVVIEEVLPGEEGELPRRQRRRTLRHARGGAGSQAGLRWRSRTEYWRHGHVRARAARHPRGPGRRCSARSSSRRSPACARRGRRFAACSLRRADDRRRGGRASSSSTSASAIRRRAFSCPFWFRRSTIALFDLLDGAARGDLRAAIAKLEAAPRGGRVRAVRGDGGRRLPGEAPRRRFDRRARRRARSGGGRVPCRYRGRPGRSDRDRGGARAHRRGRGRDARRRRRGRLRRRLCHSLERRAPPTRHRIPRPGRRSAEIRALTRPHGRHRTAHARFATTSPRSGGLSRAS